MNIQQMPFTKVSTLLNALSVAAEKYRANAAEFRELKPSLEQQESENPDALFLIHSNACDPLAEQFDRQATEVEDLIAEIGEFYDA